ncbi:MAG: HD-like signal output (HDOD) protein [Myxococcota bacterium]|jgi:HD-like signal output (HDOD) protein
MTTKARVLSLSFLGSRSTGEESVAQTIQVAKPLEQELLELLAQTVRSGEFEPPQMPHIAVRILNMSRDPAASMRKMGTLIAQDPVLAAKVLHMANSAAFQGADPVETIHKAMIRVGLDNLKQLIFMYAFKGQVFRSKAFQDDMSATWRHSIAVGIAADLVARRRGADIHLPFAAGLIHDIGRAVSINAIAMVVDKHPRLKEAGHESIMRIIDKVHGRLGGLVGSRWGLPAPLKDVLGFHHQAVIYRGKHRELILTVGAADWAARMVGLGYDGTKAPLTQEAASHFAHLGLTREDFDAVLGALEKRAPSIIESI